MNNRNIDTQAFTFVDNTAARAYNKPNVIARWFGR